MELMRQVENSIRTEGLIRAGERIVVAVSGGPDSMALLHVLFVLSKPYHLQLVAAHVNHCFRGEESDLEAETVRRYAAELGIPCEIGRIDVPAYIQETGMNAQAAARTKRYGFLFETAVRHRARKVALAHHADDQAETMLMRFLRGTGPSGLTGIPVKRIENKLELIRPLLRIYKTELERYCRLHEIPVCRDSSNALRKYFRNEVRLDVLPYLRRFNDKLPEALNRLADLMQAEDDWMEAEAARHFTRFVEVKRSDYAVECRIDASDFRALHLALQRRVIKLILNYVFTDSDMADFNRIEIVRQAVARDRGEAFRLDLGDEIQMVREYDDIRFARPASLQKSYSYDISQTAERILIPEAELELECGVISMADAVHWKERHSASDKRDEAVFDLDGLVFPLSVRSRRPGDRMAPYGLKGTKKVKDMFVDEKLAPARRDTIPLVLDADGRIIWIPGVRRSSLALVSEQTSRVFYMKVRHLQTD